MQKPVDEELSGIASLLDGILSKYNLLDIDDFTNISKTDLYRMFFIEKDQIPNIEGMNQYEGIKYVADTVIYAIHANERTFYNEYRDLRIPIEIAMIPLSNLDISEELMMKIYDNRFFNIGDILSHTYEELCMYFTDQELKELNEEFMYYNLSLFVELIAKKAKEDGKPEWVICDTYEEIDRDDKRRCK